MFGSLQQFIEVELPIIGSKLPTEQKEEEKVSAIDQFFKKTADSNLNDYTPSDKSWLLARFNVRNLTHKKNASFLSQNIPKNYALSQRKPIVSNTSFFGKNQITKDYIAKSQQFLHKSRLKRKHNLLRAIVRTNQNQNQNEGVSDYDQSFKRLYQKFQSIYVKPILEYKNFVIDESFNQHPSQMSIKSTHKHARNLSNRKRIQYQNCLNWARKHNKKADFYEIQLEKNLKQKKQEKINLGHSMMPQLERRLKTLINTSKPE